MHGNAGWRMYASARTLFRATWTAVVTSRKTAFLTPIAILLWLQNIAEQGITEQTEILNRGICLDGHLKYSGPVTAVARRASFQGMRPDDSRGAARLAQSRAYP